MSETNGKQEMVRVRVKDGRSYCEDEYARTKIHLGGEVLDIPRHRLNHTVEPLDKPSITATQEKTTTSTQAVEPDKSRPQHRMIESPRGGGRKS